MIDGHDQEPRGLEAVHHALAVQVLDRGVRDEGHLLAEAEALEPRAGLVQVRADLDVVASVAETYLNSMHV